MEPQMQPLAMAALATGAVIIAGVTVTLILTRRNSKPLPAGINRWQFHGTIPLAASGLALGVISRSGGQSPATHDITFAVAVTLFLAALLCALIGAATAVRQQPTASR
jgi:hypothetical protein